MRPVADFFPNVSRREDSAVQGDDDSDEGKTRHGGEPRRGASGEEAPLLLRAVPPGEGLEAAIALLVEADRPEAYVRSWCAQGDVFALCDVASGPGAPPAAAVVVIPVGAGRTVELRVVASSSEVAGTPEPVLRRWLLAEVADALRSSGAQRLVAAASNAELHLVASFQEAGFRVTHVERDGCTVERGWVARREGIAHRDLLWFEQEL